MQNNSTPIIQSKPLKYPNYDAAVTTKLCMSTDITKVSTCESTDSIVQPTKQTKLEQIDYKN